MSNVTPKPPPYVSTRASSSSSALRDSSRIFVAMILRDMQTRFGGTYIAYVVAIGWPLSHMLALFLVYWLLTRLAPIGDDPGIFVATGIAPYVACLYPARLSATCLVMNQNLLMFPIVKPIHLMGARCALEALSAFFTFSLFFMILYALNVAVMPYDPYMAFGAICASILFGVSIGMIGILLYAFFKMAAIIIIVVVLLALYFLSGVFLPTVFLSENANGWLWYNPLYHTVGLLRASYYESYEFMDFSFGYVLFVSATLIFIALLGERMVRGKFLAA